MSHGFRRYLLAAVTLATLAVLGGCGGRYLMAQREPWRHEAEVECLSSGAVRESLGKVRISPIEGPGACGIDFPFKVSSLGGSVPLSYIDDPRPPASIPNAAAAPRWPVTAGPATAPVVTKENLPPPTAGLGSSPVTNQPLSLDPSGKGAGPPPDLYDFRKPYGTANSPPARTAPRSLPVSGVVSPYEVPPAGNGRRQIIDPPGTPSRTVSSPSYGPLPQARAMAAIGPVGVSPAATLACPLVSALDQWIDEAVQPAAMKWFGQPVVEIQQISAYSCRGMNGDPDATISEHAFGNALDIAAFTLADGRKITVQHGWRGAAAEQAFLHDVQAAACDEFTTVLAPGSNAFHYNHMHVDLMRRQSGHRACQPQAISGEGVAARLGLHLSTRLPEPSTTGSVSQRRTAPPPKPMRAAAYSSVLPARELRDAVPGADGQN
jgi:hypothetical protein